MTPQEARRIERLNIIKESITKAKVPDFEKLASHCMMNWGTSRRTTMEYIKIVRTSLGL